MHTFSLKFILGNWQKINTEPVCFGARDNQYGSFIATKSGYLKTMKLVHKSGSLKCTQNGPASYWGCTVTTFGDNALTTFITNAKKEAVLPPAVTKYYHLDETTNTSPELVFRDLPNKVSVSRSQELQIWYGQDWSNHTEHNNSGTTCVDVYAWYA